MTHLTKTRKCCICGKDVKCDCFFGDYGLVKLDNSGETYVEFDACEMCMRGIAREVRKIVHKD